MYILDHNSQLQTCTFIRNEAIMKEERPRIMSEPLDPRLRHGKVRMLVLPEEVKEKAGNEAAEGIHKSADLATAKPTDVETNGYVMTPTLERSNSVELIHKNA